MIEFELEVLCPEGCNVDPRQIYLDILSKDCDSLRKTIEENPDQINEISFMDGYETTPLNFAVRYSSYDVVKVLVDYNADPRIAEPSSCTPICKAFTEERLDIIDLLLKQVDGEKIKQVLNTPDTIQHTALHYAVMMRIPDDKLLELLERLIKAGARPRRNVASLLPSQMCSNIHVKKLLEDCEAKELFGYDENNIKHDKKEIEPKSDNNKTLANSKDGERQVEIDLIAKNGATTKNIVERLEPKLQKVATFEFCLHNSNLNSVVTEDGNDKDNGNAHQNVYGTFKNGVQVDKSGSKRIHQILSEQEDDPHLSLKPRKRKMSFFAWISDLVTKKSKKKKLSDGETQVEIDIIAKDGETTKNIVEKLEPKLQKEASSVDRYETTPLHSAVWIGRSHDVKLLLEHNADPLVPDPWGALPIHIAFCLHRNLDIIYHLLNPDLVDKDKIERMLNTPDMCHDTALHYAARTWFPLSNPIEIVDRLIKAGARPSPNRALQFPSEMCNDKKAKKLLEQCEAKEFLEQFERSGLPDCGYDENNTKQDNKEIESESGNKTSANSKDVESQLEGPIAEDVKLQPDPVYML